jgi:ubiquinone/menaquinone biosynthesis C-methylase UbiE
VSRSTAYVSHAVHPVGAIFDRLADSYDRSFTDSLIGRAQRNAVWKNLLRAFHPGDNILELNCGTGEDALFLASRGINVFACDASPRMIAQAEQRLVHMPATTSAVFCHLPTESIGELTPTQRFDGAFSNFSGLNCVQDLTQVATSLRSLVKPGGTLLLCFSTRLCLTELAYYLVRGNCKKAFRRFKGESTAALEGNQLTVFYPTVSEIRQAFAPHFRLSLQTGIGVAIPPSYLEPFIRDHPKLLHMLTNLESLLANIPLLRSTGDHVLLGFEKVAP